MLRHWLQLSLTEGVGPILTRRLIDAVGGAEAACNATVARMRAIEGIGSSRAIKLAASLQAAGREVERTLERARDLGISLLCPDDSSYPPLLRQIPDPPSVLYVRGQLQPRDLNAMAIVGSRKCTLYGREQADRFAALLATAGFCVISGGARGVDSAAHRGAMSHPQGRTIAVLGSGLDVPYPPENLPLFDQIATRGAVISEYPFGTPPVKENFPRRNRIVSGMSRGVLVVEADERSGALITARQAIEDHNRIVFAIPGRVDNPLSAGPHKLIREGAMLVTKLDDLLDGLGPLSNELDEMSAFDPASLSVDAATTADVPESDPAAMKRGLNGAAELSERQRLIVANLSRDPLNVDGIIERTTLDAHVILQELTFLSLRGVIRRVDGQSYVLPERR